MERIHKKVMHGAINTKPLSNREQKKLELLEDVIEARQRNFHGVGSALGEIQDEKLYRIQAMTFELYALEVWGMAERTAYQYISAARVMENLRNCAGSENSTIAEEDLPTNEAQCRPLSSLKPEIQADIWLLVIETSKKEKIRITAALVTKCLGEYKDGQFRKKIAEAKEKLPTGTGSEHGTKISPKMDTSFRSMLATIETEVQSRWRNTSKDMVRNWLQDLLTAVDEL